MWLIRNIRYQGAPGDIGARGFPGLQGLKGSIGSMGPPGLPGLPGQKGERVRIFIFNFNNEREKGGKRRIFSDTEQFLYN